MSEALWRCSGLTMIWRSGIEVFALQRLIALNQFIAAC